MTSKTYNFLPGLFLNLGAAQHQCVLLNFNKMLILFCISVWDLYWYIMSWECMPWQMCLIIISNAKLFRYLPTGKPSPTPQRIAQDNYKAICWGDNYGVMVHNQSHCARLRCGGTWGSANSTPATIKLAHCSWNKPFVWLLSLDALAIFFIFLIYPHHCIGLL